jgi:3'-5' exoribonuclease
MSEEKKKHGNEAYLKDHHIMGLEHARNYLHQKASLLPAAMRDLAAQVLHNHAFWECPAAKGRHQAYPGGLAIHTAQMLHTALDMATGVEHVRCNEMVLAAIWHDVGKMLDYKLAGTTDPPESKAIYEYTEHQELIGHLPKSYAMFYREAADNLDPYTVDFVGHLILAHHGRLEWRSPVEPKCFEAFALHCGDMVSSQFIKD